MPDARTNVVGITYHFTLGKVAGGQHFLEMRGIKYRFTFFPVLPGANYIEAITKAAYNFAFKTIVFLTEESIKIIPTSFFILTSRTDPGEPQPTGLQPVEGEFETPSQSNEGEFGIPAPDLVPEARPRHIVCHVRSA